MASRDEVEFERHIQSIDGVKIERGSSFDQLLVDGQHIQYGRSKLIGSILTSGRIAIYTGEDDGKEADRVYKKLRAWLRKRHSNKMVCFGVQAPENLVPTKNFWIGPQAQELALKEEIQLKQFVQGNVFFKVAQPTEGV